MITEYLQHFNINEQKMCHGSSSAFCMSIIERKEVHLVNTQKVFDVFVVTPYFWPVVLLPSVMQIISVFQLHRVMRRAAMSLQ